MRSLSVTAVIFVLASTVCAALNPATPGYLATREPARRPKLCPCRLEKDSGCKKYGEKCSRSSECCGDMTCSSLDSMCE
ncbi:hypothetical protein LY78DRAFT_664808 [Colletotrichum sublineola]|nr:hypothetical protein LY78DRAFT_664808 [Colletotrichum sublineola]